MPAAILASPAWAQYQPVETSFERQLWVMGTVLSIRVGDRPAVAATEDALQAVRDVDALLSTWAGESELAGLNRSPVDAPAPLSPSLDSLLAAAFAWADSTDHAFEPVIGALGDAWDLRGFGRVPDSVALRQALAATGPGAMTYEGAVVVRHRPEAWIDSDGFGKGAALRAATQALTRAGIARALLNFGGQVVAIGAWRVPVADPRDRSRPALTLQLRDVSAATSAQSERGVEVAGHWYGHVLDPRSGRPVPPWGSVTVLHHDPLAADALSTALFVMGPDRGLRWAEAHGVAALFLVETPARLVVRTSSALDRTAGVVKGD